MEGLAMTPAPESARAGRRRDLALLALLLLLAGGVRAWVVWCTEVPARDSIGFIRYALQLERGGERGGWYHTLNHQHQHPGYPLCVLGVSLPLRHFTGKDNDCELMQFSAQLVSAVAGMLLVIPMYYLGKHLLDRGAGFWGALLFQCLPVGGHVLSDAVSDPLFLLLLTTALLFAVLAVRRGSPRLFALAGAWCGLSYLTRPEGILVLMAAGLVLLGLQAVPARRRPWRRVLAGGAALLGAALVTGSPYYLTTGCFTRKPSFSQMEGRFEDDSARDADPGRRPLLAAVWAVHLHDRDAKLGVRMSLGAVALAGEFVLCFQYVGWLPALVGLWWYGGRYRQMPEAWVVLALFTLDALVLWWLAVKVAYVSERHVLVLIVCAVFQTVAVVREAPYRFAAWLRRRRAGTADARPAGVFRPLWRGAPVWSLMLLLALTGTGLAKTLRPLHGNRAGHRAAGYWLAAHADAADPIDDDHCWAHYYANRVFLEGRDVACPSGHRRQWYVVVNRTPPNKLASHPRTVSEPALLEQGGEIVYRWPENVPDELVRVLVYRLPHPPHKPS
jgi:hypothetical protein